MNYSFGSLSRRSLFSIFSFLFLWMVVTPRLSAQTTLSPGDIVLVNVNSDDNDNFDFVPLVDLQAGTEIIFTDNAWVDANDALNDNEGTVTYTATSTIAAGTVVSYSGSEGNDFVHTSGSFDATVSGDNILVYQGEESTPTFLYGAGFARGNSVWEYDSETSPNNRSDIPPGLSEADNTIISLGTTDNYRYDPSSGTEGTKQTILELVGDESNWNEDDDIAFNPLSASFDFLSTPTVAFSASTQSGDEGTTVSLTVELAEANNESVSLDVVFDGQASSATSSDLSGFTSQPVSFNNASTGVQQTVQFTLADNDGFEGEEKAIFKLQNNNSGSIISPEILTLTINDGDSPDVIINEILYDPGGDANGDGTHDTSEDEFIEFVNNSNNDLDISSWTVSDGAGVKYTFERGTVIPAGNAFVVFADQAQGTSFGGAYLFNAGSLVLNNGEDDVILKNAEGATITSYSYNSSVSSESITRNEDLTGDFEAHSAADGTDSSPYSPGSKIDGTPFGSAYAIGIRGSEGWRLVGTPTKNTTFDNLFSNLWTQGIPGSDAASVSSSSANIYSWNERNGGTFNVIGSMDNDMTPGQGYIVYVYEDDNYRTPGIQGGFPKVIRTDNAENDSPVDVEVSALDANESGGIDGNEGFNLLSNPYGTDISVDAVISALENISNTVNLNISIWDASHGDGNGGYVELASGNNETIAPFQAFFVRFTEEVQPTDVSFNRSNLAANQGTQFYDQPTEIVDPVSFELYLGNGNKFDTYEVQFNENGTLGEDRYDAYKLFSLNSDAISFFSTVGDGVQLSKNVLPSIDNLDGELRVPLTYDVPGSGEYSFSWGDLERIPAGIELQLVDNETGRSVDLRNAEELLFNATSKTGNQTGQKFASPTGSQVKTTAINDRFELIITKASQDDTYQEPSDEPVVLSPNYPNPFSTETTMELALNEEMHVEVTIWNIVAQKVATLVDKVMSGEEEITWNVPSNMPSGIYICKVEAGGKVITRKMTLVK